MTATVTHNFTCGIADDPVSQAAGEVLPSHWNANHTVTGLPDFDGTRLSVPELAIGDTPFVFTESAPGVLTAGDGNGASLQIAAAGNWILTATDGAGNAAGSVQQYATGTLEFGVGIKFWSFYADGSCEFPGQVTILNNAPLIASIVSVDPGGSGYVDAFEYRVQGNPGIDFSGAVTNITVVKGIVTAAS